MGSDEIYVIKSFKHNGQLHRMWLENWMVPGRRLIGEHARNRMSVLVNCQTPIEEADGKVWVSRIPSVAFFIPGRWYNVIALIEDSGIRYYCNIASPPYVSDTDRTLTYIDYDLDVIRTSSGDVQTVDQEEFERHKISMHYPSIVTERIREGLTELLLRIEQGKTPFADEQVMYYYELWKKQASRGIT